MNFYIGKVNGDTLGHKTKWRYLPETLATSFKDAERKTNFLAGFASWKVVCVELKQVFVKKQKVKIQRTVLTS